MSTQKVFFMYSDIQNKIKNNEKVVIESKGDIKNDILELLYNTILKLNVNSIYEVGFRMGRVLISLRNLLPNVILGGCEKEDLNCSYVKNLFGTIVDSIGLEVKNFLERITGVKNELVYTIETLSKYTLEEQKKIIENMIKISSKYIIIVEEKLIEEIIKFIIDKGFSHTITDNVHIFTKKESVNVK